MTLDSLFDSLYETLQAGGWVMLPIFLVGAWGFYLLLTTYFGIRSDLYRRDFAPMQARLKERLRNRDMAGAQALLNKGKSGRGRGIVASGMGLALENSALGETALRRLLAERLGFLMHDLDRHLPFVSVLAATAPLLGLLGTVTGMVHTFQVITVYGNSNPVLMADGISEALITTQSGLVIAFPLLLLKHRLEDRVAFISSQVELGVTMVLNQLYHVDDKFRNDPNNPGG